MLACAADSTAASRRGHSVPMQQLSTSHSVHQVVRQNVLKRDALSRAVDHYFNFALLENLPFTKQNQPLV